MPLRNIIMELNENVSLPWLILGDYRNVLKFDEKCNGVDVTPYEIKDLANCCPNVALTYVRSIGCFYTWTNGSVWSKIDRAMVNDFWVQNGAFVEANFLPSQCLSDHSPCIVSIHDRVGAKQVILCKKLRKLKGALKELNFKHFGHISARASEAKNDLEAAQLQLHNQPMNMHFQLLVAKLRKKTVGLCEAERSFYYQKAKCVFLKQSDKCTMIFHSIVKRNSRRNFMATILKEDGRYTTSQDQVAMEFVNFYTSLLGENCPTRSIEMEILTNGPLVSLEEGNNLIRDISYEEIKNALFDIGDEKLRPILGDVVDHAQAAFVEAYDSVCWDFLRDVLHGLQFPSTFVHWVMECVTSTSYSIALNETLHGFFKGRKCIRQGDPLSPFLFVICIEYLSRLLKAATDDSDFNFHPKCGPQKITHLAFADDLMLFVRGDVMSVKIVMDCLSNFRSASGLRLNVLKSSLFTAGTHGQILEDILELTSVPRDSMSFRYLGILLASEKLKVGCYAFFLDKITTYIGAWNCSTLSYVGKIELIRAVLQGVECLWLSIFPIPATIISRIVSLYQKFLWGSKKSLVSWKYICLPKEEGGLGLKDLKSWNLALLAKSLWNIHNKKDTVGLVRPWKDHSSLFKKLLEIRDILHVNGAAQQFLTCGQQGESGHMVAGISPSRHDVSGRNYTAGNAQNWGVTGQHHRWAECFIQ
ncbi:uncharacterized protein LOC111378309 [Olea europaea var. sylvestris]|uniref:uncharacterized protein LOC111378309 n=1 Tax=Olea europaea var. sylvestris TaxID=158386 RepID=UPI000C1D739F|nr:uncharacterized protein LOC111378309 [Olea europaea var. sylvestris]